MSDPALAEVLTALEPQVAEQAIVVVERSARSPEPTWPQGWQLITSKHYGETVVYYAEPASVEEDGDEALAMPTGT